jgi:hypothetical protein
VTNGAEWSLQEGCRVIRLITGEAESPWPGALLCTPDGVTGVAVDAAVLGGGWAGWDADASGHILCPVDVLRRAGGHDVLLPVCTERLEDFLLRRAGGAELAVGEAVTLAVSLLRGIGEMSATAAAAHGVWWLTEAGRPVAATDTGTAPLDEQTAAHLRSVAAEAPSLAHILEEAAQALTDPRRRTRELARAEAAIFEVADPLALATTTFGPKRARLRTSADAPVDTTEPDPVPPSWVHSLSRHLDAEWADLLSRTTTALWRALRAPRTGRRRPWLVAGGLAGVVLIGGLLWPTDGGGPATAGVPADPPASSSPSPASASLEPVVDRPVEDGTEPDLAVIAAELLSARTECASDQACLEQVIEVVDAPFPGGVVDLASADRTVTLLDEFGGAAVLRVEASASPASPQLVVIVRTGDRWLLRDVYDVPEQ